MKPSSLWTLLAPIVVAGSLNAATDVFLKLDGIKGESTDAQHLDTIEIESFSWGLSNTGAHASGGGGGAGKVSMRDFTFTTRLSKATPQLLMACAGTNTIKQAVLFVRKSGSDRSDYYTITLEDVLVSSLSQTGQGSSSTAGDSMPMEQVALNFATVTISHTAADGTVTTGRAVRSPE